MPLFTSSQRTVADPPRFVIVRLLCTHLDAAPLPLPSPHTLAARSRLVIPFVVDPLSSRAHYTPLLHSLTHPFSPLLAR